MKQIRSLACFKGYSVCTRNDFFGHYSLYSYITHPCSVRVLSCNDEEVCYKFLQATYGQEVRSVRDTGRNRQKNRLDLK